MVSHELFYARMNRFRICSLGLLLSLIAVLASCTSLQPTNNPFRETDASEYKNLFSIFNSYQGSVCMGISGPYGDMEKAFEVATRRCLQYLAFYRGLAIQVDFGTVLGNGEKEQITNHSVIGGTSDSLFLDAAKDMEIVKAVWLGGRIGAVVFARLPEMERIRNLKSSNSYNYGLISVLATSEKTYSSIADAIEAATFRAAQALIAECSSTVIVDNTLIEVTPENYRKDNYSISALKMEGFTVLSYEYNIEEDKVYALAVCKQ